MKHKLFTTLLVMLMSMTVWGADGDTFKATTIEGVEMEFKILSELSKTCQVGNGESPCISTAVTGVVTIPSEVEGYQVTGIGASAFGISGGEEHINVSKVNIPEGVTTIGNFAFLWSGIESINLPTSLTTIGQQAFTSCLNLTSVYIPQNVNSIGLSPFSNCQNLSTLVIDGDNSVYDSRNNCNAIIKTNTNELIQACNTTIIPNTVKTILKFACGGLSDNIIVPEGVELIKSEAFYGYNASSLTLPSSLRTIESWAFTYSDNLTNLYIPSLKTWCGITFESGTSNGGNPIQFVDHFFVNGTEICDLVIPNDVSSISAYSFCCWNGVKSLTIPASVTSIGHHAFFGCQNMESVTVNWTTPIDIAANVFQIDGNGNMPNATLYVPRGCKAAYEAADYWKDFKEIKEYGDGNATITMGSSGIATYSNNSDLNFTSVSGLKAYIASGFNPATGNLTMTRVYEVPAGEGLILKGAAGSYDVPYEETSAYYANLLVGVPTATTVSPTDGSYTNFILVNDELKGIGFYPLASAGEMGPNKAYLQLPTSIIPAASRSLRMVFEDEEDVTGINALNDKEKMMNDKAVYDLQGRRVSKPTRGLYIKDGKKIMVK